MAGPETPLATSGFDAAAAIESATAPGMAIVGAGERTDTGTRRTPSIESDPGAKQQQLTVDIESPEYGWQLNRDDLGQGQVQQIRTDQSVTPVAEMRLPYGAIAARQQAVAEKRVRLEEAKRATAKAFDPFKGIADPAAQHQSAFAKYASNTWWPELVGKVAKAQGTTTEEANDWLYSTPEGNAFVQREAHILDGIAKESFGMTERVADLLEKHQKGEITISPEDMKVVENWMSGKDHNGMPVSGERPEDFLWKGRELEGVMAFAAFQKGFTGDFDKYAEEVVKRGGKARYLGAGRWEMSDEEEKRFAPYKEAMVESAAEQGVLNGDKKRIRERLDLLIKDKVSFSDRGWEQNKSSSSADGGGGADQKRWNTASVVTTPNKTAGGVPTQRVLIHPWRVTGDKEHKIQEATFNTATQGESIGLHAPALTWDANGRFFIEGRQIGKKQVEKSSRTVSRGKETDADGQGEASVSTEVVYGKPFSVALANNRGEMKSLWYSDDEYEIVAEQVRDAGYDMTADMLRKSWKNPESRKWVTGVLATQ